MAKKYYVTAEGLEQLKKRLAELKEEEAKNIVALQEARAQGDLSENADYDAARNEQARIAGEIKEIEEHIENAEIISAEEGNNRGKFIKVKFLDEEDEEEYQLVGTIEADPINGKISDESPLGKAILTSKVGDVVLIRTEDGTQFEVEIISIREPKEETKKNAKSKK
jgi:transcription elongation factor GreA